MLTAYPATDSFQTLFESQSFMWDVAPRSLVFDAFRACASDGDLAAEEVATIRMMAPI
jgi:hypothetical protein